MVAFANDAAGELFIGIRNEPRESIGIHEDELMQLEEQISNLIHDQCYPVIVPDISFHGDDGERFIRVTIYKGSNLSYFLKSKGKLNGTYIRVGSSNRLADSEIIAELERQKRNISSDGELLFDKAVVDVSYEPFKLFFVSPQNDGAICQRSTVGGQRKNFADVFYLTVFVIEACNIDMKTNIGHTTNNLCSFNKSTPLSVDCRPLTIYHSFLSGYCFSTKKLESHFLKQHSVNWSW